MRHGGDGDGDGDGDDVTRRDGDRDGGSDGYGDGGGDGDVSRRDGDLLVPAPVLVPSLSRPP
jgi:hypothetical protein